MMPKRMIARKLEMNAVCIVDIGKVSLSNMRVANLRVVAQEPQDIQLFLFLTRIALGIRGYY
jgi:hypothetical protein